MVLLLAWSQPNFVICQLSVCPDSFARKKCKQHSPNQNQKVSSYEQIPRLLLSLSFETRLEILQMRKERMAVLGLYQEGTNLFNLGCQITRLHPLPSTKYYFIHFHSFLIFILRFHPTSKSTRCSGVDYASDSVKNLHQMKDILNFWLGA